MQRSVRHTLDDEETKRKEAWKMVWNDCDMGLSAERWSRRDVFFSGALNGGTGSRSVHSGSVFAPVSGRHLVPGGIEFM